MGVFNACGGLGRRVPARPPPEQMYALRHIVATMMVGEGHDVAAVAANLGHSSPKNTLNTYAHSLPNAQKPTSSGLGAL